MKSWRVFLALALLLFAGANAFARDGGNSGGGGVFVELDVLAVRTFLNENCALFESFKKHQVDCAEFRKKIEEVGLPGAGLSIEDTELFLDDGKPVDAINQKPAKLQIGESGWKATGADVPLKAGLQAHEFLSLLGLEHTGYYPVSRDLVNELRTSSRFTGFSGSYSSSLSWLRSQFRKFAPRGPMVTFPGHASGRPCGLFLTDKSYLDDEDYFIVVGSRDSKDRDDYIGMPASHATGSMSEAEVQMSSREDWGNDTTFNTVEIRVNMFGKPLSALGHSDKRTIECVLDGTIEVKPK